MRVNHDTGKPARPEDKSVIVEALKPEFSFDSSTQRVIGSQGTTEENESNNVPQYKSDDEGDVQLGSEY